MRCNDVTAVILCYNESPNIRYCLESVKEFCEIIVLDSASTDDTIEICKEYLERMDKIGLLLEMELGITGGEEDGVDNTDRPIEDLYSKPEEIYQVYEELKPISDKFTVAAAFGNVHGVYKPGNVKLEPEILNRAQDYICDKLGDDAPENKLPVSFVFHGGSGSDVSDIQRSLGYGVIKMNIDTDTQWSYWEGIKNFESKYHDYLQGQIGNPEGEDKPNKKYYDVSFHDWSSLKAPCVLFLNRLPCIFLSFTASGMPACC